MHREISKPNIKSHNPHDAQENGGEYDNDKEPPRKEPIIKDDGSEPKNIVFNYSIIELTENMQSLLNLGLNFKLFP